MTNIHKFLYLLVANNKSILSKVLNFKWPIVEYEITNNNNTYNTLVMIHDNSYTNLKSSLFKLTHNVN